MPCAAARASAPSCCRGLSLTPWLPRRRGRQAHTEASSVDGEAVEQAGAAGRDQRGRAAAARLMCRVPRPADFVVAAAHAVVMADHGVAFAVLGPVAAGQVL